MTEVANADLTLTASDTLRWYRSSTFAERGFCGSCGGNLFWRQLDGEVTNVTAGTLDLPTGLVIDRHIFVASKADYYTIEGTAPQYPESY